MRNIINTSSQHPLIARATAQTTPTKNPRLITPHPITSRQNPYVLRHLISSHLVSSHPISTIRKLIYLNNRALKKATEVDTEAEAESEAESNELHLYIYYPAIQGTQPNTTPIV